MKAVSRGKALLIALMAVLVGGLSYAFGVGSSFGQQAEDSVLGASAFTFDPPAPLSLVSIPAVVVAMIVIAAVCWRFRGIGRALWYLLFGGAAIATSQLLKEQLLVRPGLLEFDAPNTFPSGHMTVFAVVVGGLIWAFPAAARGAIATFGAVLLGVVSWQLLEYGWHRPSDVLGAQALGVLAFALAAVLRLPQGSRNVRPTGNVWAATNRILGAVITVAGFALVTGGLILVFIATQLDSDALLLAASEISMVGASALAVRAMMTVSRSSEAPEF